MPKVEINLTEYEHHKLILIAAAKSKDGKTVTVEQCVKAFARSCQPGGGPKPWKHPMVKANERVAYE